MNNSNNYSKRLIGRVYITIIFMNEWMNEWSIYIALYCVLLYTQSALQSYEGVSLQPPPVCSIHLDDATAATGQRRQCAHHTPATGGEEREIEPIKWMMHMHCASFGFVYIHASAHDCSGPLQGARSAFEGNVLITMKITLPFMSTKLHAETILHLVTVDLRCISEEIKSHADVDTHVPH